MNNLIKNQYLSLCIALALSTSALAQDIHPVPDNVLKSKKEYSPFVGDHFPNRVLFGDTHVHSSYSADSGMLGNTLDPEEAYRFARGEVVRTSHGLRARLNRPLDFVVVADHACNLGLATLIEESNPELLKSEWGRRVHDLVKSGKNYDAFIAWVRKASLYEDPFKNPKAMRTIWHRMIEFADKYNEPGRFTALIGYEWTSIAKREAPGNLHRVIIFRDGADEARQVLPFSMYDSYDPEDLWKYMAGYEKKTGGSVMAIAHNGNLSNGLMFPMKRLNGQPVNRNYAEMRARFEPVYEVTQMKGDGEAHPLLSPDDEFADYGTWDKADIVGFKAKEDWMLPYEYGRSGLKVGMQLEQKLGVNPYKFGMIGSTDTHNSLASTREDNMFGKMAHLEPSADRWKEVVVRSPSGDDALSTFSYETLASGLAGVWARENTRESIWDAMKRKEVYATTGSRITVRVFAGWDFRADEVETQNFAREGYKRGVPMGGDLSKAPAGKSPSFMIRALRDPDNANLDRIQVIKGWLDKAGKTHERIYDVAVSDGRKIGQDGRCKTPVRSTVDIADASYTNTIGDPLLTAHWVDPDFDPKQRAFYYVRVIEIPKPSWTAYDAKFFGVKMAKDVVMTVQDRAYTSPIWYNPE